VSKENRRSSRFSCTSPRAYPLLCVIDELVHVALQHPIAAGRVRIEATACLDRDIGCLLHRGDSKIPDGLQSLVENLLDVMNRAQGTIARYMLANAVQVGMAFGKIVGADNDYEGSWYGNDTVWRMNLDLEQG
jgi:hypothetical protein